MDDIKPVTMKKSFCITALVMLGSILYACSFVFIFAGFDRVVWKATFYAILIFLAIVIPMTLIFLYFSKKSKKFKNFLVFSQVPVYMYPYFYQEGAYSKNFWTVYNIFFGVFIILASISISGDYRVILIQSIFGGIVIVWNLIYLKKNKNLGLIKEVFLSLFK